MDGIVIVLTLLVGNQNYNGTGVNIIAQCIDGTVRPEAFLLENDLYSCHAWRRLQRRRDRAFGFSRVQRLDVCSETCSAFRLHSAPLSAWLLYSAV